MFDSFLVGSTGEHSYLDSSRVSSSASSAVSSTSDGGQDDEGSYFDMAPLAQSLSPVQERFCKSTYTVITTQITKHTVTTNVRLNVLIMCKLFLLGPVIPRPQSYWFPKVVKQHAANLYLSDVGVYFTF